MKRLALVVTLFALAQPAAGQEPSAGAGAAAPAFSPVTWERLLAAAAEPQNWL